MPGSGPWHISFAYFFWLYFACQESSSKQTTIGKRAFGLVVTGSEYRRVSFGRAIVLWIVKILYALILYIGFITIGFTRRKQGLHDMVAGKYVWDKSRL
ncbi:RDD family protein [Methanolacinia paynteri]|uniref:RDD family protein n=1 Tax=Methanolacinia paynteri TaxID=230356 RepID=UPI0014704BEB